MRTIADVPPTHLGLMAALALGCGGGAGSIDAGPEPTTPAVADQLIAFEGHEGFVNAFRVPGVDLSDAVVRGEGAIEVVEQRCGPSVCGAVLRVLDATPNRGVAIPAPIDAINERVVIETAAGSSHAALLSVQPLDAISNGTTGESIPLSQPTLFAASATSAAGSAFIAGTEGALRWVVFGDARLAGSFDLSAASADSNPGDSNLGGGYPGAPPGEAGEGPAGGAPGDDAQPDPDPTIECLGDFALTRCGGGGGGGGSAKGGDGGGSALLVVLGALDASGSTFRSAGGISEDGGGGAGGAFLLAAPTWRAPTTLDAPGGEGAAAGRLRIDVPGADVGTYRGPAVDLAGVPSITQAETLRIEGTAMAGASVLVRDLMGATRGTATADEGGAFSLEVWLEVGLNRLALESTDTEGVRARGWSGNNVELVRQGAQALPVGATVDLVRL